MSFVKLSFVRKKGIVMSTSSQTSQASAYWDSVKPHAIPRRFWLFPECIRAINRRMGVESTVWMAGPIGNLREGLAGNTLRRGISIGCGAGGKELRLIKEGLVEGFDLFEISHERILQGKQLFQSAGLADKGIFHSEDGLQAMKQKEAYDLVFWDNALHHMDDVRQALTLSLNTLKPGGFLFVHEYVGPNRFQWTNQDIYYANAYRALLPDRFFSCAAGARLAVARRVNRPTVEAMIALDPSEAPDSEQILPAVQDLIPDARVWLLGGVIYHLALNDVVANFRLPEDSPLLDTAMLLDQALSDAGQNHYAVILYRKSY